ncbi:uncharacterized protein METZ01_LOCUS332234, partial [marine metagenome]
QEPVPMVKVSDGTELSRRLQRVPRTVGLQSRLICLPLEGLPHVLERALESFRQSGQAEAVLGLRFEFL